MDAERQDSAKPDTGKEPEEEFPPELKAEIMALHRRLKAMGIQPWRRKPEPKSEQGLPVANHGA